MIAPRLVIAVAPILLALSACAQLELGAGPDGQSEQAFQTFVAAQDEARHQLRLFEDEPHGSCTSEHLAKASAGANANLALLDPSQKADPTRPLDPSVVDFVQTTYGGRPIADAASLTLDIANAAARSGCKDQARVLYRYVIDRYVKSDYIDYRQQAEAGLAEVGGE
jgi:hypothetical protein